MIITTHIQKMLGDALRIAQVAELETPEERVKISPEFARFDLDEMLTRAVNLARHAAEELEDERLGGRGFS